MSFFFTHVEVQHVSLFADPANFQESLLIATKQEQNKSSKAEVKTQ